MRRTLVLPLAAALIALAAAAPAGALSGDGVTVWLSAPKLASPVVKSTAKTHTCQAGDTKEKTKARSVVVGSAKKTAVVACEQPPRSELLGPGLKQAAANVLATLG